MKILYVENHPYFAEIVSKEFLHGHEILQVKTIDEAINRVRNTQYDCALVDFDLDDGKGDEFISFVKKENVGLPCIAVSSHEQGNSALLAAGAIAVCSKMEFSRIAEVIKQAVNR